MWCRSARANATGNSANAGVSDPAPRYLPDGLNCPTGPIACDRAACIRVSGCRKRAFATRCVTSRTIGTRITASVGTRFPAPFTPYLSVQIRTGAPIPATAARIRVSATPRFTRDMPFFVCSRFSATENRKPFSYISWFRFKKKRGNCNCRCPGWCVYYARFLNLSTLFSTAKPQPA